ncbi:MAG: ABC transporter substrate-binding protein [Lachnospiraceae bacterium]|nr:ABC transporter substrate-binding protein [Lachnospiraceae bacterium]
MNRRGNLVERKKKRNYAMLKTLFGLWILVILMGCGKQTVSSSHAKTGSMELSHATQFQVDYYEGGYAHIHVEDGYDYVLVPKGKEAVDLGISGAIILPKEPESVYLAASASMDLIRQLNQLSVITSCSTKEEDYCMEEVKERIQQGLMTYVGKYSAPDYEMLLSKSTDLVIENSMIYHNPKVKEQLERLGMPVFVERSSYEEDPLGRLEWIRLYGLLLGCEEEADAFFSEQMQRMSELGNPTNLENAPTVVVFYVSANGTVNVRKPGDYLTKMIAMAGGSYGLAGLSLSEENALSTINITWEDFYREAVDCDYLIYNGTIDGGMTTMEEFLQLSPLLSDFRGVKEGHVYCTNLNIYQESSKIVAIIEDFSKLLQGRDDLTYLHQLEN